MKNIIKGIIAVCMVCSITACHHTTRKISLMDMDRNHLQEITHNPGACPKNTHAKASYCGITPSQQQTLVAQKKITSADQYYAQAVEKMFLNAQQYYRHHPQEYGHLPTQGEGTHVYTSTLAIVHKIYNDKDALSYFAHTPIEDRELVIMWSRAFNANIYYHFLDWAGPCIHPDQAGEPGRIGYDKLPSGVELPQYRRPLPQK